MTQGNIRFARTRPRKKQEPPILRDGFVPGSTTALASASDDNGFRHSAPGRSTMQNRISPASPALRSETTSLFPAPRTGSTVRLASTFPAGRRGCTQQRFSDRYRLRPQPPGPLPPIASAQNARRLAGPRWETAASSLALSGKTPPCGPHPPRSRPIGKRHAPRHAQARKRRNDTNAGKDSPSSDPPPKTVGNAFAKYFHEIDRIYLQRIIFCLSLYPQ